MENMHEDLKCMAIENEGGFKEIKNYIKHLSSRLILQSPITPKTTLKVKAEMIMSGTLQNQMA